MVANLTAVFVAFSFTPTKTQVLATNGWQYCKANSAKNSEIYEIQRIKKIIRRNVDRNTDDQEKLYKK